MKEDKVLSAESTNSFKMADLRVAAELVSRAIVESTRTVQPQESITSASVLPQEIARNAHGRTVIFDWKAANSVNDEDFVEYCYSMLLGRPADDLGRKAWVDSLGRGSDRGEVLAVLGASGEFLARGYALKEINIGGKSKRLKDRIQHACAPSLRNARAVLQFITRRRVM